MNTWRESTTPYRVARSVLLDHTADTPFPAPLAAPASWFEPSAEHMARAASGVATPFTIALDGPDQGRVWGDCAPLSQCILDGRPGCWTVPAGDDLSFAHQGVYQTAEGHDLSVGVIPLDIGHAGDGTAEEALDYMANSSAQLCIVKYTMTPYAIAACGVISPIRTYGDIVRARAAAQSGDWRAMLTEIRFDDGRPPEYRFCGSVVVNIPGLPLAVRLAAARPSSNTPVFGNALVIHQEAPMETVTAAATTEPKTGGVVYSLRPRPMFQCHDEVFFGNGRRGMVVDTGQDVNGAELVELREAFDDGTLADDEDDLTVPAGECTATGRMFDYEGNTDYPDDLTPDIVVAASMTDTMGDKKAPLFKKKVKRTATVEPCACQTHTAANTVDMGASPAVPVVPDPTNDIMLERLDSQEKTIAALVERVDSLEAAAAASVQASQIAAALAVG